jgi:hypothetical protein
MSRAPWERLDGETPRAFAAFVSYRGLAPGERSLQRVISDITGVGDNQATIRRRHGQVERWCSEHRWRDRAAAWDGHMDAHVRAAQLAAAARAAERTVAQLALQIQAATFAARVLAERIADGEEEALRAELRELPVPALLQLAAASSRGLDRLVQEQRVAFGWRDEVTAEERRQRAEADRSAAEEAEHADPASVDWWAKYDRAGRVASILDQVGGLKPDQAELGRWARGGWPDA